MSLIDKSYFVGELNIPNLTNSNVEAALNLFIDKYETKFLRQLLGAALYAEFIAGIQADPMEEKWSSLLYGSGEWEGLIQVGNDASASVLAAGNTPVVVGRGESFDPQPNQTTTTIPPAYVGRSFKFSQRGFGQLRPDEFSVTGNILTLTIPGNSFSEGDTYFYEAPYSLSIVGGSTFKTSPIANYTYYWWMVDAATKTMGVGEAQPQLENATRTNNARKMARAWNEMVDKVGCLYRYLDAGSYVSWDHRWYIYYDGRSYVRNELIQYINVFNL